MTVLRSGLNPKITVGTIALAGAGTEQVEYDTIDMRDSMSWSISADQQHPTTAGFVQIDWFIIERLAVRIWTDRFVVPAAGVQLQARGPCVSPFCRITIGIPKQAAATTQFNLYFFGTNQVYERIAFQFDDALTNPANSFGYQNVAIMDPDTLAAGYASVLASNPAFNDSGLITRPLLGGAYPNRTDVAFQYGTAAVGAEALQAVNQYLGPGYAATNANTYVIASGRTLRIMHIFATIDHTAATVATFRLRVTNLAGLVIRVVRLPINGAARLASHELHDPDGFEIVGPKTIAFTSANSVGGDFDVTIEAFEYDT